jgi:hypothetical protein
MAPEDEIVSQWILLSPGLRTHCPEWNRKSRLTGIKNGQILSGVKAIAVRVETTMDEALIGLILDSLAKRHPFSERKATATTNL